LVPKRPSVAPCGATQGEAFEAIIATKPSAVAISAKYDSMPVYQVSLAPTMARPDAFALAMASVVARCATT
jgi:hypothetical protein